jgi:hypothetical protein
MPARKKGGANGRRGMNPDTPYTGVPRRWRSAGLAPPESRPGFQTDDFADQKTSTAKTDRLTAHKRAATQIPHFRSRCVNAGSKRRRDIGYSSTPNVSVAQRVNRLKISRININMSHLRSGARCPENDARPLYSDSNIAVFSNQWRQPDFSLPISPNARYVR